MHIAEAEFVAGATTMASLPAPERAEIAFAGRSNVGKSSLINSMVNRKGLVRTSGTPGCTRAINVFRIDAVHEDVQVRLDLVDLPGYGFARRSKSEKKGWGELIETYLTQRAGLRCVVIIVDCRRGLEPDDEELIEFLRLYNRDVIVVATKLDKLPKNKRKIALAGIKKAASTRVFGYSAENAEGRDALWRALLRSAHIDLLLPES